MTRAESRSRRDVPLVANGPVERLRRRPGSRAAFLGVLQRIDALDHVLGGQPLKRLAVLLDLGIQRGPVAVRGRGTASLRVAPQCATFFAFLTRAPPRLSWSAKRASRNLLQPYSRQRPSSVRSASRWSAGPGSSDDTSLLGRNRRPGRRFGTRADISAFQSPSHRLTDISPCPGRDRPYLS